jgi:CheY-like chemotaxis protein
VKFAPRLPAPRVEIAEPTPEDLSLAPEIEDDRERVAPGDRVVLIVDNDPNFARMLLEAAREQGFRGIVALRGATAIAIARERQPNAITLDIRLPDIDGWRVLDHLKSDLATRHIPVYVISAAEDIEQAAPRGAIGALPKPVETRDKLEESIDCIARFLERSERRVLLVDNDQARRAETLEMLARIELEPIAVGSEEEAIAASRDIQLDCAIVSDALGSEAVSRLWDRLSEDGAPLPLLVFGNNSADGPEADGRPMPVAPALVRRVRTLNHLLDATVELLHRPVAQLPEETREVIAGIYEPDEILGGRKILIVDDDIRNIFALASVLERRRMVISSAETGRAAIEILQKNPDIEIVLMDIMMPEMDGFDTIKAIRQQPRFRRLPIIAVTAKAMKGDRDKCLEAGAWDYLSKPVDQEQLLGALRTWLCRQTPASQ